MAKDETDLVAYCGLHCGDCHGHQQRIPDMARDLRKELRSCRYDLFAAELAKSPFGKGFDKYDECYECLGAMVRFRCHKGCRAGGGSPYCKVRRCAQKNGLEGCWECGGFESCQKFEFLESVHGDAHIRNLRKLKKTGRAAFSKGKREWYHKKGKG